MVMKWMFLAALGWGFYQYIDPRVETRTITIIQKVPEIVHDECICPEPIECAPVKECPDRVVYVTDHAEPCEQEEAPESSLYLLHFLDNEK